jgi:hypothetical protein
MIRYAGLFSNRWRKQYLAQARIALNQPETDDVDTNIQTSFKRIRCQCIFFGHVWRILSEP